MTRAAAAGLANTAVTTRSATLTTSGNGATPSAKTTREGPAPINRSARSARLAGGSRSRRFASYAPMTWILWGWVRLRWPISAADAAASRRTAASLSRPATQASESASPFASCNCLTLTCRIRLPGGYELVQCAGVRRRGHRIAQSPVAEQLRQLREDLQVFLRRLLRDEQDEYQADRLSVGAVERDRLRQPCERTECFLQSLDPSVRNRHALPKARRPEALAVEQAVEHQTARNAVIVLE